MAKVCLIEGCDESFRTIAKRERHMASEHMPASTSPASEFDSRDLPPAVESVLDADSVGAGEGETPPASASAEPVSIADYSPRISDGGGLTIDPFDLGSMPDFETTNAPRVEVAPSAPAFREDQIASLLKVISETTAAMARTGPEGAFTDAEARLVATLVTDSINKMVAENAGGDPDRAKLIVGVGIIALLKARVYLAALRRNRRGRGGSARDVPDGTPAFVGADLGGDSANAGEPPTESANGAASMRWAEGNEQTSDAIGA